MLPSRTSRTREMLPSGTSRTREMLPSWTLYISSRNIQSLKHQDYISHEPPISLLRKERGRRVGGEGKELRSLGKNRPSPTETLTHRRGERREDNSDGRASVEENVLQTERTRQEGQAER
ncbi:hypothetical protein JOQ06_000136 [Pogonophryne albipinna]|uniref:Uncharacterized protein n=1 Tax=Pogonophryne albipinna TaxID=1090488 RepID=A0AAD6A7A2_9TELE|nr:hypothetical protein JOQ06_000136 [Pogonophryne albipinna]